MRSLSNYRDVFEAPFQEEFNRLFNSMFSSDSLQSIRSRGRSGYPKLDVLETDKEYVVEAAVPGINSDDLRVEMVPFGEDKVASSLHGSKTSASNRMILRLSGKMDYEYQYPENTTFHYKELRRSNFKREILLPDYIEGDPEATYNDGILRLVWKKKELTLASESKLIPIAKKS